MAKKWKYEEEMSHLLGTWKREILPLWDTMWVVSYAFWNLLIKSGLLIKKGILFFILNAQVVAKSMRNH